MKEKSKIFKKRKGYISINLLFVYFFIMIVFLTVFLIEKNTAVYIKENVNTIKGDYISEEALELVKINFYKAIENSFYESKNEDEFFSLMSQKDGKEFFKAKEMVYFYSQKVKIDVLNENEEIRVSDNKSYMDFSIQIVYKDVNYLRIYKKRARIFNPYRVVEKDNKSISSEDIKKLFIYIV